MAARAIWKGVLRLEAERLPVKLYSAVEDRTVHFRLLHAPDGVPVKQRMIVPQTEETIEYAQARRAYVTPEGDMVVLSQEELDALEPAASRDIDVIGFVPESAIDHRWYDRAYFLGPDGRTQEYFAFARALGEARREGVARWVMRKKAYRGALRLHQEGYPMLITLRPREEMVPASELTPPTGKDLGEKEVGMAKQLLSMLEAPFEPEAYHDEYRRRLLDLIEAKAKGKTVSRPAPRAKPATEDLSKALRASLEQERKRA